MWLLINSNLMDIFLKNIFLIYRVGQKKKSALWKKSLIAHTLFVTRATYLKTIILSFFDPFLENFFVPELFKLSVYFFFF